ncbi:unnamed protein product [Arabidopsis halleri]
MMRKELGIIKFTAQFMVRYGFEFWNALCDRVSTDSQFKFLDKRDPRYHFFSRLVLGYGHLLRAWEDPPAGMEALLEGFFTAFNAFKKKRKDEEEQDKLVDKVETDRRDFVVCDEYFVDLENKALELIPMAMRHPPLNIHDSQGTFRVPADPILFRVEIPEEGMMRKELGIIKVTALFVVRYGNEFWDALWDRVSTTETEFPFLKRDPRNDRGRYSLLFSQLLLAYGNVIKPWGLMPRKSNPPARMEAVLKGFFTAFNAFKKKQEDDEDEVVNKVVTGRRDFVVSEEYFQCFLDMEESTPLPEMLQPRRQTGSLFACPPSNGATTST